jgi:acyl-CoA reductase-like NAD-dependent aldehyde dehydrogenase
MDVEPRVWRNASPGDLSYQFPEVVRGDVDEAVEKARRAFPGWAAAGLTVRREALGRCRAELEARRHFLEEVVSRETGKPLMESAAEMDVCLARFDVAFEEAERWLREELVADGARPAVVRRRPLGPAAVVAPFDFPVHSGHGAVLAYLLAGNTVLLKPSPIAVNSGLAYGEVMAAALPPGVLQVVPGWTETARVLASHPAVRAVCFPGTVPEGSRLLGEAASDHTKRWALEIGGKNTVVVCGDADPVVAADAVAEGMCLTTGQRCDATARVLVSSRVADVFLQRLAEKLATYVPGDPMDPSTRLGPMVNFTAHERYERIVSEPVGEWVVPGGILELNAKGQHGYYVLPAVVVVRGQERKELDVSLLARAGSFAPVVAVEILDDEETMVARHGAWGRGVAASVFSADSGVFERIGSRLAVVNLHHNVPTTSPAGLPPAGGWGAFGGACPGRRDFTRFAVEEQAVQWRR